MVAVKLHNIIARNVRRLIASIVKSVLNIIFLEIIRLGVKIMQITTKETTQYYFELTKFKAAVIKLALKKDFSDKQIELIKERFKKIDNSKQEYIAKTEMLFPGEDINKLWEDTLKETEKTIEQIPRGKRDISQEVIMLLVIRKQDDATEMMVKELLEREKIYTVRDDEKTEMYIYKEGIYVAQAKTFINEYCRTILKDAYSIHLYTRVLSKVVTETYINARDFFKEQDINKIVVKNGILDLKTRELKQFNPDYIFFQKIPVSYDPKAKCPIIQKHFKEVLGNESDSDIIQELIGFCLYREYKFEKSIMFFGGGRNGKGKTISLLKTFLGIDNVAGVTIQRLESDTFAVSSLINKLANLCGDLSKIALKETGMFKNVTGRDLITANRKHLPMVEFVNHAKMIFAANELPITYDLTTAFFNRWILLKFPYTFFTQKEIDKLQEKDRKNVKVADEDIIHSMTTGPELSGLLNWALTGLSRLIKNKGFSHSKTTNEVKKMWVRNSDSFNGFCMDVLVDSYDSRIEKSELRKSYFHYCKKHKLPSSSDKVIKAILTMTFGAYEGRWVGGIQKPHWEGVDFNAHSKGSIDSNGFSTYLQQKNKPLNGKNNVRHTTLTVEEENINDSYMKWDERAKNWIPCEFQTDKGICGDTPCNTNEVNKNYCQKHFKANISTKNENKL